MKDGDYILGAGVTGLAAGMASGAGGGGPSRRYLFVVLNTPGRYEQKNLSAQG
jgi:hypothetical protein